MRRGPRSRRAAVRAVTSIPPDTTGPLNGGPADSPDDAEEQDRAARELRQARRDLTALFSRLPRHCHEFVLRDRDPGRHADGSWTSRSLADCYERLLDYEAASEDGEVKALLAQARDISQRLDEAREALVLSHLGIVPYLVRDYARGVIPFVDLVQEGYLGLLRAVDRYDPARGKFSTYAYWWVRKAMSSALALQVRMIRLPANVLEDLRERNRVSRELETRLGRQPTEYEVAQRMNISIRKLRRLASVAPDARALEDLQTTRSEGWDAILPEATTPSPHEATLGRELRARADEALRRLSPRERTIIRARFGFEDGECMTREQIGRNIGLSRERVRQIEKEALEKIYRWAKLNGITRTRLRTP